MLAEVLIGAWREAKNVKRRVNMIAVLGWKCHNDVIQMTYANRIFYFKSLAVLGRWLSR